MLTINKRHFIALHHQSPVHAGIVVCTFDPDFQNQAQRIHVAIANSNLAGQLVRVNRPNPLT